MDYEHPIYTPGVGRGAAAAAGAQRRPRSRSPAPTTAGASTRTAARSGVARRAAALRGDAGEPAAERRSPRADAALYDVEVRARAGTPRCTATSGTASTCGWSTSTTLPRLPRWLRPLARFAAARPPRRPGPHDPRATSTRFLAAHGIDLRGGRVLMLANARVARLRVQPALGLWCHDADGDARVRRRRGAQHLRRAARYLAAPRRRGPGARRTRSSTSRRSSPSTAATACACPLPGERLAVAITLRAGRRDARSPRRVPGRRPARHRARARPHGRRADPLVTLRASAP